jgi:hypothetical protein
VVVPAGVGGRNIFAMAGKGFGQILDAGVNKRLFEPLLNKV